MIEFLNHNHSELPPCEIAELHSTPKPWSLEARLTVIVEMCFGLHH
jgi:hypothetical protein